MENRRKRTVSLVLGSGGARGLAHIGVIRWLEEHGFRVESISGCSMGAVVGGVYAAGRLQDFETWARAITRLDIISYLDVSWSRSGLIKGEKIINTLIDLVGDTSIEDLPIAYTAVAADLKNGKEVWIASGRLFDAIRASISIPLFLTPFNVDGVDLIDGGVLNPVPIAPTFGDRTELTIAVNLGGLAGGSKKVADSKPLRSGQASPLTEAFGRFIDRFQGPEKVEEGQELGALDIITQAFDAMQGTIARQKLAAYPPDYTIEIPRDACRTLEFDRAPEMIALGYEKAQGQLVDALSGLR